MELLEINVRQFYSAIRILMARVMGLHECESCSAREHVLQTNLNGIIEESNYCLLNGLFLVKVRVRGLSDPGGGFLLSPSGSSAVF